MILEGLVTTLDSQGVLNIAPMGPIVDASMTRLRLRPFKTARTWSNLLGHGEGVFHVTDDVLLLAQAAIGTVDPAPPVFPAAKVRGWVLEGACRYYEFRVQEYRDCGERAELDAVVLAQGRLRDFFGFNRGKHAVVEAAILATRLHLLPRSQVESEFARWKVLVDKTGGPQEQRAFAILEQYLRQWPGGGA
jgi:hypothetical protein